MPQSLFKGPGPIQNYDGKGLRIAIVHARWNSLVVNELVAGVIAQLRLSGVDEAAIETESVPGAWELPLAVTWMAARRFDAVIAVGVLVKGDTAHFEYISGAVSSGLMRAQLDSAVPVIFGVLTVLTEAQALHRAGLGTEPGAHNHGTDWGLAAVEMAIKSKSKPEQTNVTKRTIGD